MAPQGPAAEVPEELLAETIARFGGPVRRRAAEALRQLGAVDRAVYAAVAATPTPSWDEPMRRLSNAANYSGLWLGIAAGCAAAGGPAGRRAAVQGTLAIAATSALVNLGVKSAWSRPRPDRAGAGVPGQRNVHMPASTSFPSGHAASGFAFATAIGRDEPWLGTGLRFLAAAVAYSRVHTGVHYPGDIVVGALIGASVGQAVAGLIDRMWPAPAEPSAPPTAPGPPEEASRSRRTPRRWRRAQSVAGLAPLAPGRASVFLLGRRVGIARRGASWLVAIPGGDSS